MLPFHQGFFQDTRTLSLFTLIAVDVALGIMVALRTHTFEPRLIGNFYLTNVVPFILGYLLVYTVAYLGVAVLLGELWGTVVSTVGTGPAIINLTGSILENLRRLRETPEQARLRLLDELRGPGPRIYSGPQRRNRGPFV